MQIEAGYKDRTVIYALAEKKKKNQKYSASSKNEKKERKSKDSNNQILLDVLYLSDTNRRAHMP